VADTKLDLRFIQGAMIKSVRGNGYSVERGEAIARENGYQLVE
jgi:hypothetical protein